MFRRPAIRAEKVDDRRSKWHQGILNERTLSIGERHGSDENWHVNRKIASAGRNAECGVVAGVSVRSVDFGINVAAASRGSLPFSSFDVECSNFEF